MAGRGVRVLATLLPLALAVLLGGCGLPPDGVSAFGVHLAGPSGYLVRGPRILGPGGRPFLVHGLDRPSLEWDPHGVQLSLADFKRMASWGANAVRIPLNQDFWLSTSCAHAPGYRSVVAEAVRWAHQTGIRIVILDLHASDRGADQTRSVYCAVKPGQQPMADRNSITFWRQVAAVYRNDPGVWFELYNEPHNVPWSVWLHGGPVVDSKSHTTWTAAGLQQLYAAVRSSGARNIVLAGGLNWAYDLRGLPQYAIHGYNIAYAVHPYDYGGKQPQDWPRDFGFAAKRYPLIATEFGQQNCGTHYDQAFIRYAARIGIGWTAWAWFPGGCRFPSLIQNWRGSPTAAGRLVRSALLSDRGRSGRT